MCVLNPVKSGTTKWQYETQLIAPANCGPVQLKVYGPGCQQRCPAKRPYTGHDYKLSNLFLFVEFDGSKGRFKEPNKIDQPQKRQRKNANVEVPTT